MGIRLTNRNVFTSGAILVAVLMLVAAIVRGVQSEHRSMVRMSCISNLKMIGVALHCYRVTYGSFPPAYTTDHVGRPMHSWRVIILPFLDEKTLYSQYKFDEPWDSPHNRRLAKLMPKCYRCRADIGADETKTSYLAVVGQHSVWRGARTVGFSDIDAFSTEKIMVVEVADSGIDWMDPRDLTFDEAVAGVNSGARLGIKSHHDSCANCLYMDGSVHSLDSRISPKSLADLLRIEVKKLP